MANKEIAMSKLKKLMRILSEGGSLNDVVKACKMSKRDASYYKKYLQTMPLPLSEMYKMDEFSLGKLIRPESPSVPKPDGRKEVLDKEIKEYALDCLRPHKTLYYEWEKYYKLHPDGYQYTQFKKYVNEYIKNHDYKYRNHYNPGEMAMFDPAGDKLYLKPRFELDGIPVTVLCAVMPYSNFGYMIALRNERMENLFMGMSNALEYFGCLPHIVKSDNMVQWVKHTKKKYDLQFTDALEQWCVHYDVQPYVARVRRPRDKGPVEGIVNKFYLYIYARIEDKTFETIDEMNTCIWELVDEFNDRPKQRGGLTPREVFETEEKPLMRPLPDQMFVYRHRKEYKRISSSYLLSVGEEQHYYSVPYQYVGKKAVAIWDNEKVEIYVDNERVAVHKRDFRPYGTTIDPSHMPPKHRAWEQGNGEWNAACFVSAARRIGPYTARAMQDLLTSAEWEQQQYRQGYILLGWARNKKYGPEAVESACRLLLTNGPVAPMLAIENALKHNMASKPVAKVVSMTPKNEYVRGREAFKITK